MFKVQLSKFLSGMVGGKLVTVEATKDCELPFPPWAGLRLRFSADDFDEPERIEDVEWDALKNIFICSTDDDGDDPCPLEDTIALWISEDWKLSPDTYSFLGSVLNGLVEP